MEVRLADTKATTALKQDGTLRCLLKIRYKHRDRHSVPAIAWAKRKADEISHGLLKAAELEADMAGLSICMNLVELGDHHHSSWLCWDLHLEKCTSEARDRIYQSTQEPIYMISKRGDVFIARRAPRMDKHVAESYEEAKRSDSGPRPYFRDDANPPIYITNTRTRWEVPWGAKPYKPWEGPTSPDDSDDDGKENDEEGGEENDSKENRDDHNDDHGGSLGPDEGSEEGQSSGATKV